MCGLLALIFAAISFEVYCKDKREGHEVAFGGLLTIVVLLAGGFVVYVVNWLFAHLYGLAGV